MSSAKPKALVAMSGGVDSSVAAALLVQQGYDVIGVSMRLVPDTAHPSLWTACCSLETIQGARRVADCLGIPHTVVNYVDRFERDVIADFIDEYRRGRTPNPCVRCNQRLKFGALLEQADAIGAAYVATGHYARLSTVKGRVTLSRALDRSKDQSYALASLTQAQLSRALFPLGDHTKAKTRETARALNLPTAEQPESQEICFVPDDDYGRFLSERIGRPQPGPIVSIDGEILGRHRGLTCYTIGQRKGLGLAARRPYYVVRLDLAQNTVVVAHEEDTYCDGLSASEVYWSSGEAPEAPFECLVQVRYKHIPAPCMVTATATDGHNGRDGRDVPSATTASARFEVRFHTPQRAVTPGQWAVLYDDDRVLAAGIIGPDDSDTPSSQRRPCPEPS